MAFDIYSIIRSKTVGEHLRKNRIFTALEQEYLIRNSYYSVEQKLVWMKQLLEDTVGEELPILTERVRLFETIVQFIYKPDMDVIYMSLEDFNGYSEMDDSDYELSRSLVPDTHYFKTMDDVMKYWSFDAGCSTEFIVRVDMVCTSRREKRSNELEQPVWFTMVNKGGKLRVMNVGIRKEWFLGIGFSEQCLQDYSINQFRVPLPFENLSRVKLQTPAMRNPVYGIIDSSKDCFGCWYHFLLCEDSGHDAEAIRKIIVGGKTYPNQIEYIDLSYPLLESCGDYLTYDWIERAKESGRQA